MKEAFRLPGCAKQAEKPRICWPLGWPLAGPRWPPALLSPRAPEPRTRPIVQIGRTIARAPAINPPFSGLTGKDPLGPYNRRSPEPGPGLPGKIQAQRGLTSRQKAHPSRPAIRAPGPGAGWPGSRPPAPAPGVGWPGVGWPGSRPPAPSTRPPAPGPRPPARAPQYTRELVALCSRPGAGPQYTRELVALCDSARHPAMQ